MRDLLRTYFFHLILPVIFWQIQGQEQITFYSQTSSINSKNQEYVRKQAGSQREILFLNGAYDIFEAKSENQIGKVTLPSLFQQKKSFIFQRNFPRQKDPNSQYLLHFERLNGRITVYLNDQYIFRNTHYFLPQNVRIESHLLTKTENKLEIHFESWDRLNDKIPSWFPVNLPRVLNGFSGSIYLEKRSSLCISQVTIQQDSLYLGNIIQGEVGVFSNHFRPESYELEILYRSVEGSSLSKTLTFYTDSLNKNLNIPFRIKPASLDHWSPGSTRIPGLNFNLRKNGQLIDSYTLKVGSRNLYFKQNTLYLNDRPIHLKGVNYIYQDPTGISLFDRELVIRDLLNIKSMGYNSIRIGFFPQVSQFYQLTDSLGILCLQDLSLPLFSSRTLADSTYLAFMISNIKTFQQLALKHPSVVGIGLNHFYIEPAIADLENYILLNDIASGRNHWFPYYTGFGDVFSGSDFGGIMMLETIDRRIPDHLNTSSAPENSDRQFLLSGISMPLIYRNDSTGFSIDMVALGDMRKLIDANLSDLNIAGEFLFTYQDYYLDTPSLQGKRKKEHTFLLNTKGLYTLDRQIKPGVEQILSMKWTTDPGEKPGTTRDLQAYLFLLVGIINFFIFLFIYRSFVDFRKNISRSIRRPHGFFVELLERRVISHEQSLYLMFVISLNAAVMLGGIVYFFKSYLLGDYLLSLFLPFRQLKYIISVIVWQPHLLILTLTLLIMITLYLFAIPIQLISLFNKSRIRWRQAVATSTWAASPFLVLIPFGLFFYNLLSVLNSYWILAAILLYFHLWYFLRWLNGTRVMAVLSYTRVFVFVVILFSISSISLYLLIYKNLDLFFHLKIIKQLFYLYT